MQCEYYALEGLSDLVQTIKKVRAHLNPALEIEGLLRTMYDPRNTLAQNVAAELEKHFGDKLYPHDRAAQRAARRSAVARHSGAASRQELQGRAGVSRARRRDAAADGARCRGRTPMPPPDVPPMATGGHTMIRPKGLGRGLDALLGGADEAAAHGIAADARDRPHASRQVPAAHAHGRRVARRARAVDPRAGHHAADPRAPRRRRPLRDHRRRAALARRAARRARRKFRRW